MLTLIPTGKIYKNSNNEHCLKTVYDVELTLHDVTFDNINEKTEEVKAALTNYFKSIIVNT